MKVAAYVPDLMDRSRFAKVDDVTFFRTLDALAGVAADFDVIVVDLGRSGVIEVVSQFASRARCVGFASHVDHDTIEAAKIAGVAEVYPRSRFFSRMVPILAQGPD